ncbi:uncharacterized protein EI97DRAFT_438832 [Westerdykella ornata]|uniref:Uncharacterized protein n=1 Tax=Westerdykella ornata TaxID=318751 RepID=A0A6A6JY09_WESOR|nr:uncharacterized protein EI97DRAFT_438832 [Westerdykella ornata]KAF2281492.1 hypothetical protein EI97DRAFT_438832 [Westerdykella ornata]
MTLITLAVRTRKSFLGLYKVDHVEQPAVPETPTRDSPPSIKDRTSCSLEDLGQSPSSNDSSRTDSPSKRSSKLARSLRKLRSSFDVMKAKSSHDDDSRSCLNEVDLRFSFALLMNANLTSQTPSLKAMPSVALALETPPASQILFVRKRTSPDTSEVGIHRSSPIAVPGSRQSTPPPKASLPGGTIPDTPGHLTRAMQASPGFSDSPGSSPERPELSAMLAMREPIPTPMPGTNLTFEDIKPPDVPMVSPAVRSMGTNGYFSLDMVANEGSGVSTELTFDAPTGRASHSKRSGKDDMTRRSECVDEWERVDSRIVVALQNFEELCRIHVEPQEAEPAVNRQGQDTEPSEGEPKSVRCEIRWGQHAGMYDGSGYAAPTPIQTDGAISADITDATANPSNGAIRDSRYSISSIGARSSLDDREYLQEIIRAYSVFDEVEERRDDHIEEPRVSRKASGEHKKSVATQTDMGMAVY